MLGSFSAFYDIKAFIGVMIRSQVHSESKKRSFRCLLAKFIKIVREGQSESEHILVEWAEDKILELSEDSVRDKLQEWMDLDSCEN